MDAVVHELEGRVEERRQRAHVVVRDSQPAPVLFGQTLEDPHHLVEVRTKPLDEFLLRLTSKRLGLVVRPLRHSGQAVCGFDIGVGSRCIEPLEVVLRHVDQVPYGVADLPVRAGSLHLPVVRL